MSLILKGFQNSNNRRYDCKVLKENGLFEDDENFSYRLIFKRDKALDEQALKVFLKEMMDAKQDWIENKQSYEYQYRVDGRGYILKSKSNR